MRLSVTPLTPQQPAVDLLHLSPDLASNINTYIFVMASFFEEVSKSAKGTVDKARLVFHKQSSGNSADIDSAMDEEQQAVDRWDEMAEYCPTLSWQQRLYGFMISFSLGYLIAFLSFRFFIRLVEGNPIPFAVNYTSGHILQLLSSMFLCGPKRQYQNMFDEKRRETSMLYLGCLTATLVVIFIPLPGSLKLLMLLILTFTQFAASVWYSLSYIPFGRRTALRVIKRIIGIEDTSDYAGIQLGGNNT